MINYDLLDVSYKNASQADLSGGGMPDNNLMKSSPIIQAMSLESLVFAPRDQG